MAPEDNTIASIISSITNYGFGAEHKKLMHDQATLYKMLHTTKLFQIQYLKRTGNAFMKFLFEFNDLQISSVFNESIFNQSSMATLYQRWLRFN